MRSHRSPSHRLARLLRAEGLTPERLAERLGLEASTVKGWADGDPIPSPLAGSVAALLGVTVPWLLGGETLPSEAVRRKPRSRRFATGAPEARNRVARLRVAEGLSRAQLAEAVGVEPSDVARWESGEPLPERFEQPVAALLGVTVAWLTGRETLDATITPATPDELL